MKKVRCVLTLFAVFFCGLVVTGVANATTYQEEVDIRFTFDQILNIDLSSNSLAIDNLAPGTTGTSSPIDVTVNTNNIGGYVLTASVGNTTHNTDSLTRTDGQSAVFTNIARNANLTAFSTDNTWGYSVDDGEHFFGLPLYSDSESLILKETDGATEDNTVSLLIGAKAGISQPLGDYSNVVNFKVVAKVYEPLRTFQDIEYSEYATLLPQVGDVMDVQDSRDGEVYTIGRLADGNVWLLDNLRLDLSTTRNLTTANTNITSDWTASTAITNWSVVYEIPRIATSGTGNNGDWTKDTLTSYGSGSGKIGVYYNYCAATAGTYCYAYGSGTGNATSDICPKGWRMPTSGSSGEYQALYTAYSSNYADFKNALRAPLSGYFYNGSAGGQGSYGYFWSSTYNSSSYMSYLNVNSSNVYPQNNGDRGVGGSVRCVLDAPVSTPTTLQEATDAQLAAMLPNTGDTIELDDERDCNTYRVRKLSDGNYWMIDDLRYGDGGHCEGGEGSGYAEWPNMYEDDGGYYSYSDEGLTSPYYSTLILGEEIYDGDSNPTGGTRGIAYNFCAASNATWCAQSYMSMGGGAGGEDPGWEGGGEDCWEDPSMCGGGGGYYYDESMYMYDVVSMYGTVLYDDICPAGWRIPSPDEYNLVSNSEFDLPYGDGYSYWTNTVSEYDVYFQAFTNLYSTEERSQYLTIRCIKSSI